MPRVFCRGFDVRRGIHGCLSCWESGFVFARRSVRARLRTQLRERKYISPKMMATMIPQMMMPPIPLILP